MNTQMGNVGCVSLAASEERASANKSLSPKLKAVIEALVKHPKEAVIVRILCRHVKRTVTAHLTSAVRRLRPWYSNDELLRLLSRTFEEFFEKVISEVCEGSLRFEQLPNPAGYLIDLVEECLVRSLDWGRSLDERPAPPVPPPQLRTARYVEGFFREVNELEEEPRELLYLHVGLGFSRERVSRILDRSLVAVEVGIERAIRQYEFNTGN